MTDADGTSRTLLQRARAGDPRAWQHLVALYTPLVGHWCRRWGLQPADVDDLTQEVFAAVARTLERFRKERPHDTFRGWLRGVARNKLLEFARLPKPSAHADLNALPQPTPDDSADDEPLSHVIQAALDLIRGEFQPATWRAFWLVTVDRREVADAADELKLSPNAVRVARCRVLRRLREELGDLEPAAARA